jgi:Fic family protein
VTASVVRVHEVLSRRAIVSIPKTSSHLGISQPTVTKAIRKLEDLGIAREFTGKQWGREFVYDQYVKILNEGIE